MLCLLTFLLRRVGVHRIKLLFCNLKIVCMDMYVSICDFFVKAIGDYVKCNGGGGGGEEFQG